MNVERELPSGEARELIGLAADIADRELAPCAGDYEERERFPREIFDLLGAAGMLTLPFAEEFGGGGQPYVAYLQVLEELAARWSDSCSPTWPRPPRRRARCT